MPFNQIKRYDSYLELNHYNSNDKTNCLRQIFERDIANNDSFLFRNKVIRPLKKEDVIDVESLLKHLTHRTEKDTDKKGRVIHKRDVFDVERSKRLHWVRPHIEEKINALDVVVFSSKIRIRGKWVIRTFILNKTKSYVLILEPQRSGLDYYFISAYYLEEKYNGIKSITKIENRKLDIVH